MGNSNKCMDVATTFGWHCIERISSMSKGIRSKRPHKVHLLTKGGKHHFQCNCLLHSSKNKQPPRYNKRLNSHSIQITGSY